MDEVYNKLLKELRKAFGMNENWIVVKNEVLEI
jgi:hypothetical protein